MSSVIVPNEGEKVMLDYLTGAVAQTLSGRTLGLYKAIAAPLGPNTVLSDFTVANFSGYANNTVGTWVTSMTVSGKAKSIGTARTFTRGAGATSNDVLGYYVISQDGLKVLFAEQFDASIPMNNVGDSITVVPTLTLASEL